MNKFTVFVIVIFSLFALQACKKDEEPSSEKHQKNKSPVILATVGNSKIDQLQFMLLARKTWGEVNLDSISQEDKRKLLQSMIMLRSVSLKAQSELNKDEISIINEKAKAYKEELLVQTYLGKKVSPEIITQEMILDYYHNNKSAFGESVVRTYEMLSTKVDITDANKDSLETILSQAKNYKDWGEFINKSYAKDQLTLRQGKDNDRLVIPMIRNIVQQTNVGDHSQTFKFQKKLYIIKVIDQSNVVPKPVESVASEIRKILNAKRIKREIASMSKQIMQDAEINIIEGAL